jgi:hypothetical protein
MARSIHQRSTVIWAISLVAIAFGLLSVKQGGAILFSDGAARAAAGHYVPLVVWFNFFAGFFYVAAGAGLWLRQRWSIWLTASIAFTTFIVFAIFGIHVLTGGAYEQRTIVAMSSRTLIWSIFAILAWRERVNFANQITI